MTFATYIVSQRKVVHQLISINLSIFKILSLAHSLENLLESANERILKIRSELTNLSILAGVLFLGTQCIIQFSLTLHRQTFHKLTLYRLK